VKELKELLDTKAGTKTEDTVVSFQEFLHEATLMGFNFLFFFELFLALDLLFYSRNFLPAALPSFHFLPPRPPVPFLPLILSIMNHPNIVRLYGVTHHPKQALIMEFCTLGSLSDVLYEAPQAPLSSELRFKIMLDIALGLEYMHTRLVPPLTHRDLRSVNCFVRDFLRVSS
jgi:serine/threonine protein kinase